MEVSYGNQNPVGTAPEKKLIFGSEILTRVLSVDCVIGEITSRFGLGW